MNSVHTFPALRSSLILSSHLGLAELSLSSPQSFRPKFCMHFSSPVCATWTAHFIFLHLITLTIFDVVYKLWSSSLYSLLQPPATSSLLGPDIFLSALFSKTFNLCSPLSVRAVSPVPHNPKIPSWNLGPETVFVITKHCFHPSRRPPNCISWMGRAFPSHSGQAYGRYIFTILSKYKHTEHSVNVTEGGTCTDWVKIPAWRTDTHFFAYMTTFHGAHKEFKDLKFFPVLN
jgi:hypothetical protein